MEDFKSKIQAILDDEDKLQAVSDKSFDKYDIDHSGLIDTKEYKKIVQDMYAKLGMACPTDEEIMKMLKELDADASGQLDKAEFKEHTRKLLHAMLTGTLGL